MNIPAALRQRLFIIDYVDATGERSQRRIAPREIFDSSGRSYLEAFCISRNDLRRFRLDRVRAVFCDATGEDLGAACQLFQPEAPEPDPQDGSPTLDMMQHCLRVLAGVAWADGSLDDNELQEIGVFVRALIPRKSAKLSDFLTAWGGRQRPDIEAFRASIERVAQNHASVIPDLLDACGRLASADGEVRDVELEWMDHVVEVLGRYGMAVVVEPI